MDSLEEYIALIARENHVILDRKDSICILHTILAKFERDLLESQKKFSMISAEKSKPFV